MGLLNNTNITFRAILAIDEEGGIGLNNSIPWHYPDDLKKFRQRTWNSTVIMGKNTQDSISKPLPNRTNITVSSSYKACREGFKWAVSAQDAISECVKAGSKEAWIIGGPGLIKTFIEAGLLKAFYITTIPGKWNCDVKFDPLIVKEWTPIRIEDTDDGLTYWVLYPPRDGENLKWEWLENYEKNIINI